MTKDEMIKWLEEVIEKNKGNMGSSLQSSVAAADLLASLNGWKVQRCSRASKGTRDFRLDKYKGKKLKIEDGKKIKDPGF